MKNDKPNNTEIENLSAYLDHELTEVEENQLRGRLAHNADLREKLEDLRLTRYTLRHTPKVRRQRSFTLSPELVRKQKFAWSAMNVSRMVAAAASVLFAVVVGGEVLFGGSAGILASAPADEAAVLQDSAEMENMEEPMAMQAVAEGEMGGAPMEEPATGAAVEEPSTYADDAAEESVIGEGVEPTPTMQPTNLPSVASEPEATEWGVGGGAPPTETPNPTPANGVEERTMPSQKSVEESQGVETEMPALSAMGEESSDEEALGMLEDDGMDEMSADTQSEEVPIPLIRWVQGGLLVLAVLSGAAALYFRKTVR